QRPPVTVIRTGGAGVAEASPSLPGHGEPQGGVRVNPPDSTQLWTQVLWLFLLAIPIACIAWTVTHEEVFREPREYCLKRSHEGRTIVGRKFFYLFTCEYCFSHYVTIAMLIITKYTLLFSDWRGYLIAGFALVF